jgi:hypothetical protein
MSQLQIPFKEIIEQLDEKKWKRYKFLTWKARFSWDEARFLLKITFDLTDKDFEYLIAYILEQENFDVSMFWKYHKWIDIEADKNWKKLYIQCKQLSSWYVNESKAGSFLGNIRKRLEERKNDEYFYYVTTSYVWPDAEEYFKKNGVLTISNKKLIDKCKKCWLMEEAGWSKLVSYIQRKRLEVISINRKSNLTNIKDALKMQRVYEFCNHLPPNKRITWIANEFLNDSKFINTFFAHWDI